MFKKITTLIYMVYMLLFSPVIGAKNGDALEFFTWQATSDSHKIVMVKLPGQTFVGAMTAYISSLLEIPIYKQQLDKIDLSYPTVNSSKEAVRLITDLDHAITHHIENLYSRHEKSASSKIFPLTPLSELLEQGIFQKLELPALEKTEKANILFVAGEIGHLHPLHWRPLTMLSPFRPGDMNPFMLAPIFDINLSPEQSSLAKSYVAKYFDALFLMGGEDIDPNLYGEKLTFAKGVNAFQDHWEFDLLQNFLKKGQGLVFGICRGMQLYALSQGSTLIQDLIMEGGVKLEHLDSWHPISTASGQDSLLRAFVNNKDTVEVYSYHHQGVVVPQKQQKNLMVTSTPLMPHYPIPEAIQSKDGRGFAVQFHPELMGTSDGDAIMRGMARYANFYKSQRNSPTCRNLARAFIRNEMTKLK